MVNNDNIIDETSVANIDDMMSGLIETPAVNVEETTKVEELLKRLAESNKTRFVATNNATQKRNAKHRRRENNKVARKSRRKNRK